MTSKVRIKLHPFPNFIEVHPTIYNWYNYLSMLGLDALLSMTLEHPKLKADAPLIEVLFLLLPVLPQVTPSWDINGLITQSNYSVWWLLLVTSLWPMRTGLAADLSSILYSLVSMGLLQWSRRNLVDAQCGQFFMETILLNMDISIRN